MEPPQHHPHSSQFYTSSEPVTERISSKRFLGDADRTVGESVTGLKSAMKKELLDSLSINPNLATDIFPDASLPFTINTALIDKLLPVPSTSRSTTDLPYAKPSTRARTTTTKPISAPKPRAQRTTNRVKSTSTPQSSSTATHANSMSRPRTRGTPGHASGGNGSLLYHPPSDWSETNMATWMNNIGAALEGVYRENHSTDPRAYKGIHGVKLTSPKKIWIPHYSTTPLKGSEFKRKPDVILVDEASIKDATWPKVHALSEVTRTEMSQSKTIKDTIHQKSYIMFKAQDNRCFVPSLSFTCGSFTLTVCDRAGVVDSQTWKVAEQPLTLLRIIAGLMFARPSDIGYDETIDCKEGKATSILSGGVEYTVEEELFASDSVKGRATKCWRASTGEGGDYREEVVIKDSWADVRRTRSEIETLTVIKKNGLCDGYGIPELVHGEDVLVCGVSGSEREYVVDSTARWRVRDESGGEERVHRRIVMKPVGRHITNFKSLKELVGAFMDITKGSSISPSTSSATSMLIIIYSAHAVLCNKGILHRDISINNVMLSSPKNTECPAKGLLIDYDYAFCSSLLFSLLTESAQPPPAQPPPAQPSDPSPSDPPAQTHGNETSTEIQDREILLHRTVCILIRIKCSYPSTNWPIMCRGHYHSCPSNFCWRKIRKSSTRLSMTWNLSSTFSSTSVQCTRVLATGIAEIVPSLNIHSGTGSTKPRHGS